MTEQYGPESDLRQNVRVRDMVRLQIEVVEEDKRQELLDQIALARLTTTLDEPVYYSQRMEREMKKRQDTANAALLNRLSAIEAKLDALLQYLTERDLEEKWGPLVPVNISAGGLLFPHDKELPEGTLIKIEMMMQTMPPHPVTALGEVKRCDNPDPKWHSDKPALVAVKFVDLDPEDRDRIIHRVFEVQRMFLRRSKSEADETVQQMEQSTRAERDDEE